MDRFGAGSSPSTVADPVTSEWEDHARRMLHFKVTEHPTKRWTAQQLPLPGYSSCWVVRSSS